MVELREYDGARSVYFERRGGSVFAWRDNGASFEFDAGIFLHQMSAFISRELDPPMTTGPKLADGAGAGWG